MKILDLKTFNEKLKINPINILDLDNTEIDHESNADDFMEKVCWNEETDEGVVTEFGGYIGSDKFGLSMYFWTECGYMFYDEYDSEHHRMTFYTDIAAMYSENYVFRYGWDAYSLTTAQADFLKRIGIDCNRHDKLNDGAVRTSDETLSYFYITDPTKFVNYFKSKFRFSRGNHRCNVEVQLENRKSGIGDFASIKMTIRERLLSETEKKDVFLIEKDAETLIRTALQQSLESLGNIFVNELKANI